MVNVTNGADVAVRLVALELRFGHLLPRLQVSAAFEKSAASFMKNYDKFLETMERVGGIEPPSSAWKAIALPLSYTR